MRELPVGGVATTYVTGTLTGLLAGLALGGTSRRGLLRQAGVVLALVAGAVIGTAVLGVVGAVAALIPVTLVAVVVAWPCGPGRHRGTASRRSG